MKKAKADPALKSKYSKLMSDRNNDPEFRKYIADRKKLLVKLLHDIDNYKYFPDNHKFGYVNYYLSNN